MAYFAPIVVALVTLVAAAASAIAVPTAPDSAVAAVFPPWWDRSRAATAIASADGLILRSGAIDTILVVRPGPVVPGSVQLADRLRAAGALLVINADAARGCLEPA
jgi:hypothetical protein